ncbi:MAG TPA: transglutaminase family protein [Bryobacteraceae bacterium]|nr:transglutaminase family protein [Bryobacteraceae bacterium]
MQLFVEHSTVYRFNGNVHLEPHTFRLRPRMSSVQRLLLFDLQIWPAPVGAAECLDQDGNLAMRAWFSAATSELSIRSRFRVELLRTNAYDFLLDDSASRLPLWYAEPSNTALAPYRNFASVGQTVREYANGAAVQGQWDVLLFLNQLNEEIFRSFRHVVRPEGAAWPSDQTLLLGEGSCRDLAVLFCDACRTVGIAARFVSGYECATAGRLDASMHAWAEVFLPDVGWRGFDPSRGLAVANGHVAVASGFDPMLAAPIAGMYSGGCGSGMEVDIQMAVEANGGP